MQNNLFKNTKDELIEEILRLRNEEEKLRKELGKKDKELENKEKELEKKDDKIKDLEGKLSLNSSNSSKPPSTNLLGKKTQICNSRVKGNKPIGGQIGHKGNTLKQSSNPDVVEIIPIHNCENCSADLNEIKSINESKRQVIDIPKPTYIITEYIAGEKICPCCNYLNKAKFSKGVNDSVQYGPNIKASSVYMYNYIYSSYERLEKYWKEIYDLDITQPSLLSYNKKGFEKLEDFEEKVKISIIGSSTMHSDETGVRVSSKTNWIHVASTNLLTSYFPHAKRGKEGINAMGILPNFKGNLVSDHWFSYVFYKSLLHYFCNAHHLRELKWVTQNEKKKWADKMVKLLVKSKELRDNAVKEGKTNLEKDQLESIHLKYKQILLTGKTEYKLKVRKKGQKGRLAKYKGLNLAERLELNEKGTLGFLHNFDIPFDNNLAERDIRMVKTRTKISGCFRSFEGVQWFCRIRSYISTIIKQKGDVYNSILSMFNGDLILPNF